MLWLNGALHDAGAPCIAASDRGFTLGDGVFETLLWRAPVLVHAALHFARLRRGAALLGIPVPYDDAVLEAACARLAQGRARAALRVTLTRGPASRGVLPPGDAAPTVLITVAAPPQGLPEARLIIAKTTRRNEFSPLSRIKSLNYGDCVLARMEAARAGCDDAILCNTQGLLAETSAATLILRIGGALLTPPEADGALPGIRRGRLLAAGRITARSLTVADAARAEAGLLINALGTRGVAAIEGRPLPGRIGPEGDGAALWENLLTLD